MRRVFDFCRELNFLTLCLLLRPPVVTIDSKRSFFDVKNIIGAVQFSVVAFFISKFHICNLIFFSVVSIVGCILSIKVFCNH